MNTDTLDMLENRIFVLHTIFERVNREILRFIQYGQKDECLCIIGPTGVGKTKMIRYIVDFLIKRLNSGWRSGLSQPLVIEASSQVKNEFPWRSFLEEMLLQLGENDPKYKIDLNRIEELRREGKSPSSMSRLTIGQLERLLRLRVNVLKPVVIIIDESQNMVEGLSFADRKANINRLKNWANTMDTTFILFGTHESKDILNLNEQLTRRISPVYFPRYSKNVVEIKQFASFYKSIVSQLDLKMDPAINEDFLFTYNHTLGCPGLMVKWLHHCISYCIDNNLDTISKKIWAEHRLSSSRLLRIESAIKSFEFEYEQSLTEFNPDEVQMDDLQLSMDFDNSKNKKPTGKGNPLPGKQKPRRHPIDEI